MYSLEQPKDFSKVLKLLEKNSDLNLLPILELVVYTEPEYGTASGDKRAQRDARDQVLAFIANL